MRAVFPRGPLEPDPDEIRALIAVDVDALDAARVALAEALRDVWERYYGNRPPWLMGPHFAEALLPVVDRIANQRAAAELRAAADEPDMYDVFIGHGVSVDELRRIADQLDPT